MARPRCRSRFAGNGADLRRPPSRCDGKDVVELANTTLRIHAGSHAPALAVPLAFAGRADDAREVLHAGAQRHTARTLANASPFFWGHYVLGEHSLALQWLAHAIENREYWLFSWIRSPHYVPELREYPQWQFLMQRLLELESRGSPTPSVATRSATGT